MSKYSIHDLSRMEFDEKNKLARFNMPFELGLDLGARRFGGNPLSDKCLLILDKEKYRYQQALSDISGKDVEIHKNQPEVVVRKVRNWIRKIKEEQIDSANKIWRLYVEFTGDFFKMAQKDELSEEDIDEMPWDELSFTSKNG